MAARKVWLVECELCGRSDEYDGALTVDELGAAFAIAGWYVPRYGGTFHRKCYNRMRVAMGQPPLPEPDPVRDLFEVVQRVKNIVWQTFGVEPGIPQRALPAGRWPDCIGYGCPRGEHGCFICPTEGD